jgi:prepilin-type N-terminal cleavage/methylation domain-containing protein
MTRRATRTAAGFTLVELVSAMIVFAVISVLASRIILTAADQYISAASRAELSNELSAALERITAEVRDIRPSSPTTPDVTSLTASSLSWNDATGARSIALQNGTIVYTDATGSSTLVADATSFTLQGYDGENAALPVSPSAADIQRLRRIELTIACTRSGVTETLRTKVFLRCFTAGAST